MTLTSSAPTTRRGTIDTEQASPPAVALRERLAQTLIRVVAGRVPVDIQLPDGSLLDPLPRQRVDGAGDANRPRILLQHPDRFYRRLARAPKIGIGEGYTAGDWSPAPGTDLADVLTPFAERVPTILPSWLLRLRRLVVQPIPREQHGAKEHTQDNISAHYDLSNEMFAAFLDRTMTYSSALFDRDRPLGEQDLTGAQLRKIDGALDLAGVSQGTTLLEIGTGWGALALAAAGRGAQVTTVTLSVEQADLARERIAAAGMSDRVEVIVQDYRDITGTFDAIVSVEMIEAVGERYWPEFFATLRRLVRPGGSVALQSILMSHERYLATRDSYGWIQKHIFPGGLIPSTTAIEQHAGAAGLEVTAAHRFGTDYAETLHRWRSAFLAAWPTIQSNRFGEDFRRTWEFYLAYCEAGFRTGYIDVAQLQLRPGEAR